MAKSTRNIANPTMPQSTLKESLRMHRSRISKDVRSGRGVSVDFFRKNGWLIFFFTVVILALIGLRYRTRIYMQQINELTEELNIAEKELVQSKAAYMTMIRESDMVELSRRHNLGLEFPLRPAYTLSLSAKDSVPVTGNASAQPSSSSPEK